MIILLFLLFHYSSFFIIFSEECTVLLIHQSPNHLQHVCTISSYSLQIILQICQFTTCILNLQYYQLVQFANMIGQHDRYFSQCQLPIYDISVALQRYSHAMRKHHNITQFYSIEFFSRYNLISKLQNTTYPSCIFLNKKQI